MLSRIILSVIFMLSFLLFSCGSTSSKSSMKKTNSAPFFMVTELALSKGIDIKKNTASPVQRTTNFTTEDTEVVASLKLENLTGKHQLKWDWYDPSGKLYYSTGDYTLSTSRGTFRRELTAWHRLSVRNEKASNMPGDWLVKIYLDNEPLKSGKFKIDLDLDKLHGTAQKPDHRNWGLIIGIEDYSNLPSVDFAKHDAMIMKEYFIKVFGVPEENIISLINNKATKSTIGGYLKSYIPKNIEKDSLLYIYLAGHGLPYKEKGLVEQEPYLVSYDSDIKTITETGYRLQNFYEDINNLDIKKAFIFLDACFSGMSARGETMLLAGARPIILETMPRGFLDKIVSITASSSGQISNSYPEKRHGLFSYFLLRGLRGEADSNSNGSINVEELYSFIKKNVEKVAHRKGMEQNPSIFPAVTELDNIEVTKSFE